MYFPGLLIGTSWTNGLYYIGKIQNLYTIQNLLNKMVTDLRSSLQTSTLFQCHGGSFKSSVNRRTDGHRLCGYSANPDYISISYKYYAKGIALGAVKG